MRIVIDLQGAQGENANRGIGRYCLSWAISLIKSAGEHEVYVVLNGSLPQSFQRVSRALKEVLPKGRVRIWEPIPCAGAIDLESKWTRKVNEVIYEAYVSSLEPDVFVVSSLFEGLVDNVVVSLKRARNFKVGVILYDLIPHIFSDVYLGVPEVKLWYSERLQQLRHADFLLAISESTRQDAIAHLCIDPSVVRKIGAAAEEVFRRADTVPEKEGQLLRRHGIGNRFVLYTGGIDHRKNIARLIQAFARLDAVLRREFKLVIVCSITETERERLQLQATESGLLPGELILTGYISDEDLIYLYRQCALFVFPSWYEGFGLPALEAMACGAPVIASDRSSLPEVIGRDDALFDPYSTASIAEKIEQVLSSDGFKNDLCKHGILQADNFSWRNVAARSILNLTEFGRLKSDLQGGRRVGLADPEFHVRPRLAFVSPIPPSRSGIADYAVELLPFLSRYYDIEIVTSDASSNHEWINANAIVRTVSWAAANKTRYDRVLYHFGNSAYHGEFFELLKILPGIVVLHDFYLSAIIRHMDTAGIRPNSWMKEIYDSHGYAALLEVARDPADSQYVWSYPCNLNVLRQAKGVIVHSKHSCMLAEKWIRPGFSDDWATVPLLRTPPLDIDKASARDRLHIAPEAFVACSFGLLGPMKLNEKLLNAWVNTSFYGRPDVHLIFVGQNSDDEYGRGITSSISSLGSPGFIKITGWTSTEVFRDYLSSADLAVQLRTLSRGETSAAALDCLNYGVPLIANANGSMAELPLDCVQMLDDEFSEIELIAKLEFAWRNRDSMRAMGLRAMKYSRVKHSPQHCAELYLKSIEGFYLRDQSVDGVIKSIAEADPADQRTSDLLAAAKHVDLNFPRRNKRQLFIDISELVRRDSATGIQRVVRAILLQLLRTKLENFSVEPVYAPVEGVYSYARQISLKALGINDDALLDEPIEFGDKDIFLGLDLHHDIIKEQENFYRQMRRSGVKVCFVVYDLLPIQHPQFFVPQASELHSDWARIVASSDMAICISKAVEDEYQHWVQTCLPINASELKVRHFHLGADVESSLGSSGLPANYQEIMHFIRSRPTFIMVGTIEPRKGQADVFEAFERLWKSGENVGLIIVGKQGWMVEEFVELLQSSSHKGMDFYWLNSVSDEFLQELYKASTCLIAASYAEGFGLPLVEASHYGLPVIARDIPVFREVAEEYAHFFEMASAEDIENCVRSWISLFLGNMLPDTKALKPLTWAESSLELISVIES